MNENTYEILHLQENNETNSYDIGSDLQIRNYSYIDSIQTPT